MSTQPDVFLYALSTCIHCRHTREYLDKERINYDYVYVDKLEGQERQTIMEQVRELNPRISFPTMVCGPERTVVIGFDPEAIRAALQA